MSDLDESLTEQSLFEKQHDALMERCGEELHWNSIHKDSQAVAILEEEVRLARASNDKDVCMQCADDISDFSECSRGNEFKALEIEMLLKAAELGSPDANYRLGNRYRWGKDLPRDYEKAYVCYRKGEVHICFRILFTLKKEHNNAICSNMDGPRDCHTE